MKETTPMATAHVATPMTMSAPTVSIVLAVRNESAHIEQILPVVGRALDEAGVSGARIDAVAVANRPGLIGSLLVGVTAAKTLAWLWGRPLVAVDHVQAHLYSVCLDSTVDVKFPAVGLVVGRRCGIGVGASNRVVRL
jgi:tRNA A37 threonylcarbamoyltransferase TsaD